MIQRRHLLCATALPLLATASRMARAQPRKLVISGSGGVVADANKAIYYTPYTASKGVAIDNSNSAGVEETKLNSRHQNTVTSLNVRGKTVTTAGIDGCVFYWDL